MGSMNNPERAIYQWVSKKTIGIVAALLAVVVIVDFTLYFAIFLPLTGGTAYLELNIGYLPDDLFDFAEAYGEGGRSMYIAMSCTLDMLVPLLASLLLTSIAFFLAKRSGDTRLVRPALVLGFCCCLSDWAENVCMMSVLVSYPEQAMTAAVFARVFTTLKYLFVIALVAVVVAQAFRGRGAGRTGEDAA